MTAVRRSLLFSVLDRYATQLCAVATMAVMARLLTPAETGLFLVASGILLLVEGFRDFGVVSFLVQERELSPAAVRTAFTVTLALSLALGLSLYLSAGVLADLLGAAELALLLRIGALGFLLVPFSTPVIGHLRRELDFRALARINVTAVVFGSAATIGLALWGLGAASYAWGMVLTQGLVAGLAVLARPQLDMFRPSLAGWRRVFSFGLVSSLVTLLNMAYDFLPRFAMGRMLGFDAVGLYGRALTLCQLPDRAIVSALQPVVLPAMAARVRAAGDLKATYLRGLRLMSAVQWPLLLGLALLAEPVVRLLLGPQWQAAAPLLRVMALASMATAPAFLTFPVLVATGRIRDTLTASLISLPPSALIVVAAAAVSVEAVALTMLVTAPLQMAVALLFVRRAIRLAWSELLQATARSMLVTLGSALVPCGVILLAPRGLDLDLPRAALAMAGGGVGWLVALRLTGHPLLGELHAASIMVLPGWWPWRRPARRLGPQLP